ncbi:hypothetical protein H6G06_20525 [Anabaena sphaerica FACHB-251]|uniref:Uncharacterized protein n=1 Tax=Anabaena sphaerica FACHB-251 TaxID=2692883 RepID=A0A926WJK8_9NOST|nr:hypothetical protein [Anabaena sphaerica]MBD2295794.1 hypothetical protein [Anabaena sphaerica FACHB-251]
MNNLGLRYKSFNIVNPDTDKKHTLHLQTTTSCKSLNPRYPDTDKKNLNILRMLTPGDVLTIIH